MMGKESVFHGTIEAREVLDSDVGSEGDVTSIMKWSGAHLTSLSDEPGHGYLELSTGLGTIRVVPGDWIVRQDDGSFAKLSAGEMAALGWAAES